MHIVFIIIFHRSSQLPTILIVMFAYLSRRYHWLNEEFTSPLLLMFFVPDNAQGVHILPGAIYTLAIYRPTQHIENIPLYSSHPPFSPIHTLIPIHSSVLSTIKSIHPLVPIHALVPIDR